MAKTGYREVPVLSHLPVWLELIVVVFGVAWFLFSSAISATVYYYETESAND